jgi:O-antigen/teichoic acid export membrane protein
MKITPETKKKMRELVLNIGGIALFNMIIQFAVYPFISGDLIKLHGETVGKELWGNALTLISFVGITAVPLGSAANSSRTVNERKLHPSNGDYNLLLLIGSALFCVIGEVLLYFLHLLTPLNAAFCALLVFFSVLRYYSDTAYKTEGTFGKFFLFYLSLSVGYLVGLLLYVLTKNWILALFVAELFAVVFAIATTKLYKNPLKTSEAFPFVVKSLLFLLLSEIFENLTLHSDLLLRAFTGGTEVSVYYTAALLGKIVALLTAPISALLISYLVRYDGNLSKKLWSVFTLVGVVGGIVVFGGCLLGSHLFIPLFYPEYYEATLPILIPAIASQIFYFVSRVLLVVLLRFYGEKKQFFFNLLYAVEFFALVTLGVYFYGLKGFVYAGMIANALRLIAATVWGFIATRKPPEQSTELTAEQKSE